ncbi:MAG: SpoIIE family protein phosphatase [Deltaproteobacteria bacterium]|nr:SpoIIE family protein phosphatase [Deltaproteobacteria bacterium]
MPNLESLGIAAEDVLDQTLEGIYVVDPTCKILYWNRRAEQITGWTVEEVLGRRCSEDVLVHVDRHGRQLCSPGRCPLHRCMSSKKASATSQVVFARKKDGGRVPVSVSVSPLINRQGTVVGGVEVFSDETENMLALEQARRVQRHALPKQLPRQNPRFEALYRPCGVVGGDCYQVESLDADRHAFMLADVSGHGLGAALYTMTLQALWHENAHFLDRPAEFLTLLNRNLETLTLGDSFATAFMGVVDTRNRSLHYSAAGHPPALLRRPSGEVARLEPQNLALGMLPGESFQADQVDLTSGSTLLVFSDGALEAESPAGHPLGLERLQELVAGLGGGEPGELVADLEKAILDHAETPALEDDLTFLAVKLTA